MSTAGRAATRSTRRTSRPPRSPLGPSLQRRVGRFTLLIVALAVLVTALGGYLATRISAYRGVDTALATATAEALTALGPRADQAAVARYVTEEAGLGTIVVAMVRADGQVLRTPGSDVITVEDRDVAVAAGRGSTRTHSATSGAGAVYRVRVVPVGQAPGVALLVARPMAVVQQILDALALALLAFGLVVVVAAGVVARRIARAGARRCAS